MKTVTLHGQKAAGRVALVDDEDYDLVMQYRWFVQEDRLVGRRQGGPYAVASVWRNNRRSPLYMHKLITGYARTDHEDHDGLNNQRSNLRNATSSQNNANQLPSRGGSSRYKGVSWEKRRQKWVAYITVHQRRRELGHFLNEEDAARAYDAAALDAWGGFAFVNLPAEM